MGSVSDFLNSTPGTLTSIGSIMLSIVSLVLAYTAFRASQRSNQIGRINANSWETYKLYNSPEVLRGRRISRDVAKVATWNTVRDEQTYQQFFAAYAANGAQASTGQSDPLRNPDQDLHYLLQYYHQVGLLLRQGLLDVNFTMLLVGEALADRWNVVGRVPTIYPDYPYQGIYVVYDIYKRWVKEDYPKLLAGPAIELRKDIAAQVKAGQILQR